MTTNRPHIALVHGGFVDGSGWQRVYELLTAEGHPVTVVQNPTIDLEGDVAATTQALDAHDGPTILVGHSYGGVVITEAGNHPAVEALVYITAFAPDKGESVGTLIADPPPGAPVPPILSPRTGSCSSTETSSQRRSPRTCPRPRLRSWPIPRSRGSSRPSTARSASPPGVPSGAGTSSPLTTT